MRVCIPGAMNPRWVIKVKAPRCTQERERARERERESEREPLDLARVTLDARWGWSVVKGDTRLSLLFRVSWRNVSDKNLECFQWILKHDEHIERTWPSANIMQQSKGDWIKGEIPHITRSCVRYRAHIECVRNMQNFDRFEIDILLMKV